MFSLLLCMVLADPSPEPDPPLRFEAKLRRPGDKFEAKRDKGVVVWTITSPGGIGGVEVLGGSEGGPKKLVVRLANFRSLEAFSFTDGVVVMKGALNRMRPRTSYQDASGRETNDPKKAVASITVSEGKSGVEVTMTFQKPGNRYKVEWIDAYRK